MNNIPVLVLLIIVAGALIAFLVIRNIKDKRDLTEKLNQDYRKSKDSEDDVEEDDKA
jgi:hypothetical protein